MSGTPAPTPADLSRDAAARRLRVTAEIQVRLLAARRRDTARNGYAGPLTRAELARLASR
jgi:hypothetical protein